METFSISEKSYRLIIDVLKRFDEVDSAVIFGSRATGNYRNGSDIDLALKGDRITPKIMLDIS